MLIVLNGEDGHRREYAALFKRLAQSVGEPVELRKLSPADIFRRDTVFLPMLEEQTGTFLYAAFLRHLLGRRSAALLFRPREVVTSPRLRHRVKKSALRFVRNMSRIQILTILPFEVEPKFSEIAAGWIYDPQLWDLKPGETPAETALIRRVKSTAAGRSIIIALGAQNADKGFDFLADLWASSPALKARYLLVVAGRVVEASRPYAEKLDEAGALLFDRFMEDAELQQLYSVADLVWSAYAPTYDQASGIFGRAVQWGIPTAVRAGSYLEPLSTLLRHPAVAVPWGQSDTAGEQLDELPLKRPADEAAREVSRLRRESLNRLSTALGLPPFSEIAPA